MCTTCCNCNIRDTCVLATACVDMLLMTHSRYSDYFHKHHFRVDLGAFYTSHLLQREVEFLNLEKIRTSKYLGRHPTACLSLCSNVRSRHDTALEFSSHDSLRDMCCYTLSCIGYPGVFYVTVCDGIF